MGSQDGPWHKKSRCVVCVNIFKHKFGSISFSTVPLLMTPLPLTRERAICYGLFQCVKSADKYC